MPPRSLAVASSPSLRQSAMSPAATTTSPEGGRGGRSGAQPAAMSTAMKATMTTVALLPAPRPPSVCRGSIGSILPREIPDRHDPDHTPELETLRPPDSGLIPRSDKCLTIHEVNQLGSAAITNAAR